MARRGRKRKLFKLKLKKEVITNLFGISFFILGLLSLATRLPLQGQTLSSLRLFLNLTLNWGLAFLTFAFFITALFFLRLKTLPIYLNHLIGAWLAFFTFTTLFKQGLLGTLIWRFFADQFSSGLTFGLFLTGFIISFMLIFDLSIADFVRFFNLVFQSLAKIISFAKLPFTFIKSLFTTISSLKPPILLPQKPIPSPNPDFSSTSSYKSPPAHTSPTSPSHSQPPPKPKTTKSTPDLKWQFPPLDLISLSQKQPADRGNVKENSHIIETTLESFGIRGRVVRVNQGAAVTQYALEIAPAPNYPKLFLYKIIWL